MGQVLEHVYDEGVVAHEALRVLRPGGRLIANVPADDDEPHGNHVRVYENERALMDLFGDEVTWGGWGRLRRFWHAWGEKR